MKTIGLIGGMSWESTVLYYRCMNETVKARLGGLHSARIVLYSVDFHDIEQLQIAGAWEAAAKILIDAAQALERAGAQLILICTNTMHYVFPEVQAAVTTPLLHIADAAGREVRKAGLTRLGLLGTRYTMEQPFYAARLAQQQGLTVLIPDADARQQMHRIIFEELCLGTVTEASRREVQRIIRALVAQGAQGVILGCTEISMLIGSEDSAVPVFDTAEIHARVAVEWALS